MLLKFVILFSVLAAAINAQATDRSVIIVGAGICSYGAAQRLIENGFSDITILEATHRIGGRIVSMSFSNGFVDMGAQWVHGQQGNSIYQMVSPHFNFGSLPISSIWPTFVLSNGTTPRQDDYQTLYGLGLRVLDDIFSMTSARGSLGDLFTTHFDQAVAGPLYRHIGRDVVDSVQQSIHLYINGYFGSSTWFDISAMLTNLQDMTGGDQYVTWRREGFRRVFDFISRRSPNPSEDLNIDGKVITNKVVTNIRYNTNDPLSRSTVTCSDGSVYTARHVIFTASLGVLKQSHTTMFTPNLPARKISSITNISMGNAGTFFMEFDRPFWITPGVPFVKFIFVWSDAHKNQAIATNRAYLADIASIYAVDQFPNVLQIYLGGPNIREFETASTAKMTDDVMWMFDMFLPHLRPIPRPIAVRKTSFGSLNMFHGAYAYPSMHQERSLATIEDLASTVMATNNMPMILFAGEATSAQFQGMSHGALDTGYRAANEIINFHR